MDSMPPAVTVSGSLWEQVAHRGVSPLDGVRIRPPTRDEAAALDALEKYTLENSPFREGVSEELLRSRIP